MNALVMLHGWGANGAVFDALRRHLPARLAVITPDLPGYGTGTLCEPHTLERIAERIAISAPPRCCVVGWSLGAQVALTWARLRPQQVERLALVAATPCFVQREDWSCAMEQPVFEAFAGSFERDCEGTLRRFAALQAHGDDHARETARQLRAVLTASTLPERGVLQGGLRILRESDLRPHLRAVQQELLVVHGERDQLVPCAAAEYLARALPRGRLELVAGAAHAPVVSDPGGVGALLEGFFP